MAKAGTAQIISIKDERLDIDQIDHYRLSFFISDNSCQIGVKDVRKKRLLLLEDIQFDTKRDLLENLDELHKDHILISAGFWKEIQVYIRNNKFSLVPNPVFDKSMLYEYVRLNEVTDPEEDIYHFKQIDELGLNLAFAYEGWVKDWFQEKYPKVAVRFYHQGFAFLRSAQNHLKSKAQASLYLNLYGNQALVAGFNMSKLALYNQFTFKSNDHLVKLTALTCQQFAQDRSQTPLILTGQKEQVEAYKSILSKYFKLLELGKRPDDLQLHPVFNELEAYEYNEILANL